MSEEIKNQERDGQDSIYGNTYGAGMRAMVRSLQAAFFVLALIIVGMVIYFFTFGGYFVVESQEYVLVLRFGRLVFQFDKGAHWVFPYPVNEIIRIPVNQQTIKSKTFLPQNFGQKINPDMGPQNQTLVPGRDGYVITGDENIMHTSWTLNYTIKDPELYYRKCITPKDPKDPDEVFTDKETNEIYGPRGPRTLLGNVLDSAVLRVAASEPVDELYRNTSDFQEKVEKLFKKTITNMNIGIDVDSVHLKSEPPAMTKPAFDQVLKAELDRDTVKQDARKYEVQQKNDAEAQRAKILAEAEAYKKRVVSEVEADGKYFKAILAQYKKSPQTVLVELYNKKLAEALAEVKGKYIINKKPGGKQEVWLKINPEPEKSQQKLKDNKR